MTLEGSPAWLAGDDSKIAKINTKLDDNAEINGFRIYKTDNLRLITATIDNGVFKMFKK